MKTVQIEFKGRHYPLCIPDDAFSQQCASDVISGKCYPIPEWEFNPKRIVDIGGHAGEFAVLAKLVWPDAEVMCWEPNKDLSYCLNRNADAYGFSWYPFAVMPKEGRYQMRVSKWGTVANSLVDRPDQTDKAFSVDAVSVAAVMANQPDVLKIDAEGVEVEIISEIKKAGELDRIGIVYMEFHTEPDRLALEAMLIPTHHLMAARINNMDQGEVTYIRRKDGPA